MRLGLGVVRRAHLPVRWWLTGGIVVLVLAVGVTVALSEHGTAKLTPTASDVTTVRRGTVDSTASAAGTVEAAATRGLSFSVSGTVTELDVKAGGEVTAGQVLARIDDADAQATVSAAQTQLSSAQQALIDAQQTPTPPPTGTGCVAQAAYVVSVPTSASASPSHPASPTPSATPKPTPSRTPTSHPTASQPPPPTGGGSHGGGGGGSTGGGGTSGGGTSGGGTGGGRTGGGSTCTGGTNNGGTNNTGGTNGGGGRGGSVNSVFSAQQQVNNAQLALDVAEQKLAGTTISAPIAGKVLSVSGTVGSSESPGSTGFIVLGSASDTEVTAQFTEADVAHLEVGQPATITLPDNASKQYTGKVSQVDPAGTTSGRLVRYTVLIAFDQVPENLLYGQSANVAVTTQSVTNVLYVSASAVTGISNGTGSVLVRAAGHDVRRSVKVGLRGDKYTEIQAGLAPGETVVLGGR